jgi:hypothetical protein
VNPLLVNGQKFLGNGLWDGCVTTAFIARQRLGKPLFSQQRAVCVTTRKLSYSTRCSLVGTRRTTFRGLLVDCRQGKKEGARSKGGFACQWSEDSSTGQSSEEDRHWDIADRQNSAGERITKKNQGARIQDREDNVFSLCGVTNNCSSTRWKSK